VGLYTDTSKLKWIFWISHHSVLLIDMLLKSSRNLGTRTNGSSDLQIRNNQSMIKMTLTNNLPENQSKPQEKKGHGKTKKDTGKWCDFHKIPWHNTDECRSKQSLVVEIKDKEPNPDSESDYENTGKRQIIDTDPTTIVVTTTIQPEEPTDPEEGEHLFHSQMWVKGTPLHFIVDMEARRTSSQQRSSNSWDCRQHHTHNHTTSGGFARDEIFVSANSVDCHTTSNPSRMRYYVMFPH
jgi:hypothetical protein